ncbi:MAG: hypothetical protein RLZZ231_884 [Bacteroidota bacterium]|jgi:hypothetical protein
MGFYFFFKIIKKYYSTQKRLTFFKINVTNMIAEKLH